MGTTLIVTVLLLVFLVTGLFQLRVFWIAWKEPTKLQTLRTSKYFLVRMWLMNTTRFDDDSREYLWLTRAINTLVSIGFVAICLIGLITVIVRWLAP